MSRPAIRNSTIAALILCVCGCTSNTDLPQRVTEIERKHNVAITVNSDSNPGSVNRLLNIIDNDLHKCSQYFKDRLGPIFIDDSFDELGFKGMFLLGYVDGSDLWNRHPIHIKNRSLLDRVLLFTADEEDVFLHEAAHSFEFNVKAEINDKWLHFYREFAGTEPEQYNGSPLRLASSPTGFRRLLASPSRPSWVDHCEDFARTYCYVKRNNIDKLQYAYPQQYRKCRAVERFTKGGMSADEGVQ